jgi:hypothetical protein
MAYDKKQSSDQGMSKTRGATGAHGSLKDAHGKGIQAESTYDLTGHGMEPARSEGHLGSQGSPQPSGGQTGMRPQHGSFESGQSDLGSGIRGEDKEPGEQMRPGVNPDFRRKPDDKKK